MSWLRRHIRRFAGDESGVITVEFLILFPLLVWAYMASFVFFDMLRATSQHQKASFVISDMLSRETEYITPTYIDNSMKLFDFLMRVDRNNALRISSIGYDEENETYDVVWSQARGGKQALVDSDIENWDDRLPLLAAGDELILVETWYDYKIAWGQFDMSDLNLHSFVYTRPRFAAVLKYNANG
ncbi:TadE/TadG family type IV pilus assembly protein [Oceanicola sp. S124]|uniref:TadE/TadG family type IV pilus assembly protein n=1 Tax=Oceanicola sp. S124 TaxID=1042378 RepID=UPI0002557ECE|nr:TadE/TadG family type IV pilus assembly protein [Oceanicola sp. S124]